MDRKIIKKGIFALAAMTLLAACGGGEGGGGDSGSKAVLEVITFDGGVGSEWLRKAAAEFTQLNQDREDFQEGKVGVQINVKADRSCGGGNLRTAELKQDVYFTENIDYYYMTNNNKFADITDILTTPNADDGGKTIESKLDRNLSAYLNRNGSYYAVPFYDNTYGLIYDKDLFKENGFYMTDEGNFTSNETEFGTGPNGVAGDWDDGLPRTYAEFKKMMDYMVANNVTPYAYANGTGSEYAMRAMNVLWSDYEGYDRMQLNYTFDGEDDSIISSFDASGNPVLSTETITVSNGYKLKSQAGKYYALKFAKEILTSNSKYYLPGGGNYDAQYVFTNNKYLGGSENKPVAMLIEGSWWENEARKEGNFEDAMSHGASEFNYGFMPIPKVDESHLGDATLICLNDSYGFIASNTKKLKLAKEFMAFLHDDKHLSAFTAETSMTRSFNYTIKESDKASLTTFGKELMDIKESEHAKTVYPYSSLKFVIDNPATFNTEQWAWSNKSYTTNPMTYFMTQPSKEVSAKNFFDATVNALTASDWALITGN